MILTHVLPQLWVGDVIDTIMTHMSSNLKAQLKQKQKDYGKPNAFRIIFLHSLMDLLGLEGIILSKTSFLNVLH